GVILLALIPCVGQLIAMVAQIVLTGVVPIALTRFYATDRFGAAFEFKAIIDFIKINFNNSALFVGIAFLSGMVGGLGAIACFVGMVFTMFWAFNVNTIALSDLIRHAQQVPAPVAPPPAGGPTP
ncbi:MAG: DUF4013 domain-containing protein, partial [Deltaproteobacteria bacterium]|nr:DUF4013 domain-containing protein [Deltaproteobacteria bacterium]